MTHEQIAAMVNRLKLAKITGCRAAYALLGATPLDKINADIAAAADLIEAQAAELATLRAERDAMRISVEALGAMPEGYCFCSKDRIGDDSKTHEPECADLRIALKGGA